MAEETGQRFSIVVVEDNPADAEILRIALDKENAGIQITRFETGADVLEYFSVNSRSASMACRCDLILLDLNLPKISGFEILQRMRRAEHMKTIPIVVMSGSSNPEEIARCYRLGATSYIHKPSHLPEIFAVAQQVVKMLRAQV
jgi:CheY-like chemotaxis protein